MQKHGLCADVPIINGGLNDETEAGRVSSSLYRPLDRQADCVFTAYASGSVIDRIHADDRSTDTTWNTGWEIDIDTEGWSAELSITAYLVCKDEPGLVSQYGCIPGIGGLDPPLHLENNPYAIGRSIVDGGAN